MLKLLNIVFVASVIVWSACLGSFQNARSQNLAKVSTLGGRVVIDAGHGGEDCGAVGKKGLMEKDVTLDIARRVGRIFKRYMPNVEVVFTRVSDHYVSLPDRVKIANKKPGDVFLSIHVNSSDKEARGFELFSLDVASARHAERLAVRENKISPKDDAAVQFILADLRANSHRHESDRLASMIAAGIKQQLKRMPKRPTIIDRGYNQAIFHVLFVNMPAIITELFFISSEEDMLSQEITRELLARGLFLGSKKFLYDKAMRARHAASR